MITLDLQTFRQGRESSNVTGVIFLELREGAFPEKGWSDFPVIILGWWTEAWLQFESPTRRAVDWLFMDGPYGVSLVKTADGGSAGVFEFGKVRSSLVEAAERVVDHCQRNKMVGRDLDLLCGNLQRLKLNQGARRTEGERFVHLELPPSVRRPMR